MEHSGLRAALALGALGGALAAGGRGAGSLLLERPRGGGVDPPTPKDFPVWPLPAQAQAEAGCLEFAAGADGGFGLLSLAAPGGEPASPILGEAFQRYEEILGNAPCTAPPPRVACQPLGGKGGVLLQADSQDETLVQGTDESYRLDLSSGSQSVLHAPGVFGALRGLETLSQLIQCSSDGRHFIPFSSVSVTDQPRFSYRGLMVDTGRHFLEKEYLFAVLDAMAYNKLNVLHWHLMDTESFPFNSSALPGLVEGAFGAGDVYQPEDLREIVAFAKSRGIRVVPEVDMPGHAVSWGAGYPELLTQCNPKFVAPLDVTRNETLAAVSALLTEIADIFPDALLHVGGDEVATDCWLDNPDVVAFMKARGLADGAALQSWFERQVVAMAGGLGRDAVVWEEVFTTWPADTGAFPENMVVEPWRGKLNDEYDVLEKVLGAGLRAVYTNNELYLDYELPREKAITQLSNDWKFVYTVDPAPPSLRARLGSELLKNLLGAETCMWAPFTDSTNTLQTVFPRASAVAERLWSPHEALPLTATDDTVARLHRFRCELIERGLPSAPAQWGLECASEFPFQYRAPYHHLPRKMLGA